VLADEAQLLDRRALASLVDGAVGSDREPGQQVLDVDRLALVRLDEGDDLVRGRRQAGSIANVCSSDDLRKHTQRAVRASLPSHGDLHPFFGREHVIEVFGCLGDVDLHPLDRAAEDARLGPVVVADG
jgi:hypothetical protein